LLTGGHAEREGIGVPAVARRRTASGRPLL